MTTPRQQGLIRWSFSLSSALIWGGTKTLEFLNA